MPTYTDNNRYKKITPGDETGTWGGTTNSLYDVMDDINAYTTYAMSDADDTITISDGVASTAHYGFIEVTGTFTADRTLTIGPNTIKRYWFIRNGTSGGFNLLVKQGTGGSATIAAGSTGIIYFDGAGAGAVAANVFDAAMMGSITTTGNATIGGALGVTGLSTLATVDINGGAIDGTVIGGSTAAAGSFTTGSFSGLLTATAGIAVSGGSFAAGHIFSTAADGLGVGMVTGSSTDFFIANPSGLSVFDVPTGTRNVRYYGALSGITTLGTTSDATIGGVLNLAAGSAASPPLQWSGYGANFGIHVDADGFEFVFGGSGVLHTLGPSGATITGAVSGITTLGMSGNLATSAGYIEAAGNPPLSTISTNNVARFAGLTAYGATLYGAGATYDAVLLNKNTNLAFAVPTGTQNAVFFGAVSGITTLTTTSDATIGGTLGLGTNYNSQTVGSWISKAGGGNYVLSIRNETAATPYTVSIKAPPAAVAGYPLLAIVDDTTTVEHFRVDTGGQVTMDGNATIGGALEVNGSTLTLDSAGDAILSLDRGAAATNIATISFATAGTPPWNIGMQASATQDLHIGNNGLGTKYVTIEVSSGLFHGYYGAQFDGNATIGGDLTLTAGEVSIRSSGAVSPSGQSSGQFHYNTTSGRFTVTAYGNAATSDMAFQTTNAGTPAVALTLASDLTATLAGDAVVGGDLTLAATNRLYLDGGGDTYITESSANTLSYFVGGVEFRLNNLGWYPATTNAYDLGITGLRWRDLYLSGDATIGGDLYVGSSTPSGARLEVYATSGEIFRADANGGALRLVANQAGVVFGGTATFGGAVSGITTLTTTSTARFGTGASNVELGDATTTNGSPAINFIGSNIATNWQIRQNNIVAGDFTITPSTAGGGTTFTTPVFRISSTGRFAFGTSPTDRYGIYFGPTMTSDGGGTEAATIRVDGNLTGASGDTSFLAQMYFQGSITTQATDTVSVVSSLYLNEPNITKGAGATVTTAATLYVVGAPTEGSANYAIYSGSGAVYLGGAVSGVTTLDISGALTSTGTLIDLNSAASAQISIDRGTSASHAATIVYKTAGSSAYTVGLPTSGSTYRIGASGTFGTSADAITVNGSDVTIGGDLTVSGTGQALTVGPGSGTAAVFAAFSNNGGNQYIGVEGSVGAAIMTGTGGYDLSISAAASGTGVSIGTQGTTHWRMAPGGNISQGGDLSLAATKRLYLDGGTDTYIYEQSADLLSFVVGGTEMLRFTESTSDFASFLSTVDVTIEPTKRLYFDGGSDTYIVEAAANQVNIVAGGSTSLELTTTSAAIPSGNRLYLDGGSDTYLTESAADVLSAYVGGTEIVQLYENGTTGAVEIRGADNGTSTGANLILQRNTNATTPAAGFLTMYNRAGTAYYLWVDSVGDLRIGTSLPTNAQDSSGDPVGTQT